MTLERSGLLDQQRLELVEGELISKMGKKRPHVNALTLVQGWLVQVFGLHFTPNPRAQDLRLVVEIADTSLNFDLTVKAALYARAKVFEYWVLDVVGRRLLVHRNPRSGAYADITVYDQHESVSPLAAPHASFRVADAFPGARD